MNYFSKSIVTLFLVSSSCLSYAQSDWYLSGFIASVDTDSFDVNSDASVGGVVRSVDISSDEDFGYGLAIGRSLIETDSGSFFIELGYQDSENDVEGINFNGNNFSDSAGTAAGDLSVETLSLTAIYRFNTGKFKPYLGFGIGYTDADLDIRYGGSVNGPAGSPPFINDSDSAFSVQYRVGAEYSITDNIAILAEYRYLDADDINVNRTGGGPGGLATTSQEGDFSQESYILGLKYSF